MHKSRYSVVPRGGRMLSGSSSYNIDQNVSSPEYDHADLSHSVKFSCNVGQLIPCSYINMTPGGRYDINLGQFTRFQPLQSPILDNMETALHVFSVPYRLVEPYFDVFYDGGRNQDYDKPRLAFNDRWMDELGIVDKDTFQGTLFDFFNLGRDFNKKTHANTQNCFLALPFLSFQRVYNDYYRAEELETDLFLDIPKSAQDVYDEFFWLFRNVSDITDQYKQQAIDFFAQNDGYFWRIAQFLTNQIGKDTWYSRSVGVNMSGCYCVVDGRFCGYNFKNSSPHVAYYYLIYGFLSVLTAQRNALYERDYFTSVLPYTQKGVMAIVQKNVVSNSYNEAPTVDGHYMGGNFVGEDLPVNIEFFEGGLPEANLFTSFNINDLRVLNAMSKFQEKNSVIGYRFDEYIKGHFGIDSKEIDDQIHPKYCGGMKQKCQISSVQQTSGEADTEVAQSFGLGFYSGNASSYCETKFDNQVSIDEPGILLFIYSTKPRTSYQRICDKEFYKVTDRELLYTPDFAFLAEQPVFVDELAGSGLLSDFGARVNGLKAASNVFGYQRRYEEYRYKPDTVHGELTTNLRPYTTSNDFGPLAAGLTVLDIQHVNSSEIMNEGINQIFQIDDTKADNLIVEVDIMCSAMHLVPATPNPSL